MSTTIPRQESIQTRKQPGSTKGLKQTLMSGSLVEAIFGAAAIVLVVIGLSEVAPMIMGAIAVIIVGIGWLSEASMLMVEYREIVRRAQIKVWEKIEFSSGCSAEAITGIAAIVLGILVLFGVAPLLLLSIAATALGAGLVVTSAAASSIHSTNVRRLEVEDEDDGYESRRREPASEGYAYEMRGSGASEEGHVYETKSAEVPANEGYAYKSNNPKVTEEYGKSEAEAVVHAALSAATGVQVVLGFTATVLGLLALVGFSPLLLTLVSILVTGIAALMIGAAISGRVFSVHTA